MPDRVRPATGAGPTRTTRVYLPGTAAGLDALARTGRWRPAPVPAFAVTSDLVAWWTQPDEPGHRPDDDELEYAASVQAAAASLALLDPGAVAAGGTPARRVVVAADVDPRLIGAPAPVGPDGEDHAPGSVLLSESPGLAAVAAVHVDGPDAEPVVRAAVAALADDAVPGSHLELVLDELDEHDLAWYAADELPVLLESLRS